MRTDIPLEPVPFEKRVDSPLWDILVPRTVSEIVSIQGHKACTVCGEDKPLSDFHLNERGCGGRNSKCKDCRAIQMADYRKRKRAA